MIQKVRIKGYRKYEDLTFEPNEQLNIFVGDNESGKSTLLEAITLVLTGRVNGRTAQEELNPYWFNQGVVKKFFEARKRGEKVALPKIEIELFFKDEDCLQLFHGAHNSEVPVRACPGIRLMVIPKGSYSHEIERHVESDTSMLPVEYYEVVWESFADTTITQKPQELSIATIDSRTVKSGAGIDYHFRNMLGLHLKPDEKAKVSLSYRTAKEEVTNDLAAVNQRMETLDGVLSDGKLSLAMDQTSRTSWDSVLVPYVEGVPFAMVGLGQQAAVKIALAMGKSASVARIVTIEEPENHLSHGSLNMLVHRIGQLSGPVQQLFITTHSSFVLNRLGMDALQLVANGNVVKLANLPSDTVNYFRRASGYDTLRIVLARKAVLVEGPSDEIIFERLYVDAFGKRPLEDGIDVIGMGSLSARRFLELAKALGRKCAVVSDNDGNDPFEMIQELADVLEPSSRCLFVGSPSSGRTLEPQLVSANSEVVMRQVLGVSPTADLGKWMKRNKTEAAILIADSNTTINPPAYLREAAVFINAA